MTPLESLIAAFKDGRGLSAFDPTLAQEIDRERQKLAAKGFIWQIGPQSDVKETIKEMPDGRRMMRYFGTYQLGFEQAGLLYPDPSSPPFSSKEESEEEGVFYFLVEPSGMIVGWGDSLTGNKYGQLTRFSGDDETSCLGQLKVMLIWSLILVLILGGLIYLAFHADQPWARQIMQLLHIQPDLMRLP